MKSHFQRKEIKYYVTQEQKDKLVGLLSDDLVYDFYCPTGIPYHISSIYYDTANYDVIRRSVAKPRHKAKLRLRTYEDNSHYLELKQKFKGTVYKKRIRLTPEELHDFVNDMSLPQRDDYSSKSVLGDVKQFIDIHQNMIKPIHIEYHRIAYIYRPRLDNVRVTFDQHLRVYDKGSKSWATIIPVEDYLMEIKATGAMPLALTKALSALKIYPTSFSKYGKYFEKKLAKGEISYV